MTNVSFPTPIQATDSATRSDPARRALSLERKLPLLMTALLAVILATSLALTYRTLARTARTTAEARLTQVVRMLATMSETSLRVRIATLQRVAADSAVRRALRDARGTTPLAAATVAAATGVLARVPLPTDSGLPVTLWTADGRRVATVGEPLDVVPMSEMRTLPPPAEVRQLTDSVRTGPMFVSNGRVYYQVVAPVDAGGERLGYVVALRRVNANPRIVAQLHDVTGEDAAIYATHRGGTQWVSMQTGRPADAPHVDGAGRVSRPGLGTLITQREGLTASPWIFVLEEPLSSVLRGPRQALASLASLGVLLGAVGAVAAWFISRRITRPLASLTAAAEAVARGDYRSRVTDGSGDEVGRLARSFNVMAAEVEDSQQALARQFADAR
ncbi:MAG: HAMP domain-containing protein, partial [Gemmatirosa sp.]|nr:HAMP domain-containing protein [Gemmatirosa sp.]